VKVPQSEYRWLVGGIVVVLVARILSSWRVAYARRRNRERASIPGADEVPRLRVRRSRPVFWPLGACRSEERGGVLVLVLEERRVRDVQDRRVALPLWEPK
jgi:hypothetical protein